MKAPLLLAILCTGARETAGNASEVPGYLYPKAARSGDGARVLHIGGIFPMTAEGGGWPGGQACLPATKLALDHVNNQSTGVLPGYRLVLHYYDSGCQPGLGARVMYELLYNEPTKVMLLSGCSLVTTLVAEAADMWNLLVLSYGASSPALSNRQRFPTLFRTHPSATTVHNPTRVHLFTHYGWRKIAILQAVEEVFTETAKDLERECRSHHIKVLTRQSFFGDPADAISNLRWHDARIIVGLFYEKEARRVFCQVYKQGLHGPKYVWFLIGWYSNTWYVPKADEALACTEAEMRAAVQYHFTTEATMLRLSDFRGVSKMTGREFQSLLLSKLAEGDGAAAGPDTGGFVEAPLAYDAVWALALGLNCTRAGLRRLGLELEQFDYTNERIKRQFFECMKTTEFQGVSGQVRFTDSGDRIARTQVEQMIDGNYSVVAFYENNQLALESHRGGVSVKFAGGSAAPPPDAPVIEIVLMSVAQPFYFAVAGVTLVVVCIVAAGVIFNWENKRRKYIQRSQPQVNNVFLAGCMMCLLSVFLWGLPADGLSVQPSKFSALCHVRITLTVVGFSLSFGSMFAKVWMVHRLGVAREAYVASAAGGPVTRQVLAAHSVRSFACGRRNLRAEKRGRRSSLLKVALFNADRLRRPE